MPRKGMQNIRVVFLGGTQVGKTSVIQRLMDGNFDQVSTRFCLLVASKELDLSGDYRN